MHVFGLVKTFGIETKPIKDISFDCKLPILSGIECFDFEEQPKKKKSFKEFGSHLLHSLCKHLAEDREIYTLIDRNPKAFTELNLSFHSAAKYKNSVKAVLLMIHATAQ